ncbi:putative TetR family transcriptional regulator [Gordonia effusa NBRC 100432]|uniref:Putative TetR family transcriptional regulator n=1 Tax=Gordonia effusa NBRC 100432 TaxID=1077974 RepID=H0QXK1_9ACTN|nr:TetR/AcrR family transcriptional regulator [Gordonia effusa]GAB17552.1 putative TetR family transcriptional regulator [Gordonia effusa NBRC 100432]
MAEIPVAENGSARGPRERMVISAADLIGRDGVSATSIGDVLAASKAPRGSIYHHFPRGKSELMVEAVRYAGEFIARRIAGRRSDSPADTVADIGAVWRRMLIDSDFQFGCPVLAGGLARNAEPAVADEALEIFAEWTALITNRLADDGVPRERAQSLANLIISAIEGAVGLCQTQRRVTPLDDVIVELQALCESAAAT